MKEALLVLFERDLNKVKTELEAYTDEALLWEVTDTVKNSGGNLCLHLIGNLKTYIGQGLAQEPYVRQRELEFSAKDVPRTTLLQELDETIAVVKKGIHQLDEEQLQDNFPIKITAEETGMVVTLLHLYGHLTYHLGQLHYHRRFFDR
ncbi:DUF1572 domain-containing protein [Aggregatimonas sangjinii]|uniref:DUF1572 domain-containing protein n=1 Tax=Aggregatimonas sangjinii TaxID=2583587 RepID=A0A5B7SRB5_9FLAO|nr:DUF1572 family protein [Aggregatimonas sangjinii]QCX00772.1 DUF1572 domain-containing protein [Aggregatimonas sangjinii]